ncbi:MAG: TIGR03085 family metal-binding protein [Corynebacterium sp.]|nr:TIGR03085 family metal-binding protein [Corynebacterium sp.]
MSFSATERSALAALMSTLGPEHPTVLPGWTTHDLLVHLVVREQRPDAAVGILVPAFARHLHNVEEHYKQQDFHELLAQWAAGPRRYNPMKYVDPYVNALEHFVHHEDVRRSLPDWRPREFSESEQQALHRSLSVIAKVLLGKSRVPVVLEPQGLPRILVSDRRGVAEDGSDVAHVSGPIGELILWAYYREAVGIELSGPADKIVRTSI